MRHDWNSLLTNDYSLLFKDYDEKFFPHADSMVRYLCDYADKYHLKIRYGVNITSVSKTRAGHYQLLDESGASYTAPVLVVATGLAKPFEPDIKGIDLAENYFDFSLDTRKYENKRVLIIGKGNSGFETADHLVASAAFIHLVSPNPVRMAWKTHYVGHLRAVNNNILDTYQLKSQNAVLDADVLELKRSADGRVSATVKYKHAENEVERLCYDHVIICAGFRFDDSIFAESAKPELTMNGKYPAITPRFESVNSRNMFFAGTITHSLDYRKATSGFIHGFRYNAKSLFHILNHRTCGVALPYSALPKYALRLSQTMLDRVNHSGGLWQQPGFMADLFVIGESALRHIEEMPLEYLKESFKDEDFFALTLEYGDPIEGDPFNVARIHRENVEASAHSKFLHPVVRYFRKGEEVSRHDVIEDLEANWNEAIHIEPLLGFLERRLACRANA